MPFTDSTPTDLRAASDPLDTRAVERNVLVWHNGEMLDYVPPGGELWKIWRWEINRFRNLHRREGYFFGVAPLERHSLLTAVKVEDYFLEYRVCVRVCVNEMQDPKKTAQPPTAAEPNTSELTHVLY